VFRLPDAWVWDFWLVDDGQQYHLFFLYASRALKDPEARHLRASIGHAVSDDLETWERVTDALVRSDAPAFDDLATWTGSVVRHPDGRWFMFYTGATFAPPNSNIQTIGYATSTDLLSWDKAPGPVVAADPQWYEKHGDGGWHDVACRDPWFFPAAAGLGCKRKTTAGANPGPHDDRGVVGHAWSADLENWEVRQPLSPPGQGFGQLEVFQTAVVDGRQVLVFNCLAKETSRTRRATGTTGGVWLTQTTSPLGPYDIAGARLITDDCHYVGKFIDDRETGDTKFLAFRNNDDQGEFVGEIDSPRIATWDGDGQLLLAPVP
jgi:beta-fructofuranosidase